MEASAITQEFPAPAARSFEVRIVSTWLPLSVIVAAVLGFETWLGPKGAYYALAILPGFPLLLAMLFVGRSSTGTLKTFVVFLIPYLALEWAAEIYYLGHWITIAEDPAVPSFADYCWLASYVFLIWGSWVVASGHRGLRLQAKDAFLHGVWIAAAATTLIWLGRAVIASNKPAAEAVVMGLYPFFDAVVISLLLVIRTRHRSETVRAFWFILLIANLSILGGDVMWLLSKSEAADAEALVKIGDAFYILGYLLDILGVWVAFRVERTRTSEVRSAETEANIKRALSAGGLNSLASVPIVVVLGLVFVAEKGIEHAVIPMVPPGPVPLLGVSGVVAFGLKAVFRKWEKKLEAIATYREEFRKRLQEGSELDTVESGFLDRLRVAIQITPGDARAIESRVLQEREDELRARLEVLQRDMFERRSAEEWQAAKSAWLSSIRDLRTQLQANLAAVSTEDPWSRQENADVGRRASSVH